MKKDNSSNKESRKFTHSIYDGIIITVIVVTIWHWISPNDYTWVQKFGGFFIIGLAIAKMLFK